jgi:dTDP-4-dehydrorhamnose 3,5-epimerase
MEIIKTPLSDVYAIEPRVFEDSRGYFFETYSKQRFSDIGIETDFVIDYQLELNYGTVYGIHYQLAPYSQTRLIRAVKGEIICVVLDIRRNSPSYGKHVSFKLIEQSKRMIYSPKGFAVGFSAISPLSIISVESDCAINQDLERGVRYNDSTLGIDWGVDQSRVIVSAKDNVLPLFSEIESNLYYGGSN